MATREDAYGLNAGVDHGNRGLARGWFPGAVGKSPDRDGRKMFQGLHVAAGTRSLVIIWNRTYPFSNAVSVLKTPPC
jgi:hypothetical protein